MTYHYKSPSYHPGRKHQYEVKSVNDVSRTCFPFSRLSDALAKVRELRRISGVCLTAICAVPVGGTYGSAEAFFAPLR